MKMSVCIPVYEMYGEGFSMLKRCLDSLITQTFKDFEVVVTDNSFNGTLRMLCKDYDLDLHYFKNSKRGMAANTNFAIELAQGYLIKILYQDDYLAHEDALQDIVDNFKEKDNWLVTACSNNLHPFYSKSENTIGSPSVVTIRNDNPLLFREDLKWILDLEYYQRMFKKFGLPRFIDKVGVVMGLGNHQETYHLTDEEKLKEIQLYG